MNYKKSSAKQTNSGNNASGNKDLVFSQINQRLPYKKKNKEWRKSVIDALCSEANRVTSFNYKLQENYDLYNSQLNQEDFRELCDALALDEDSGRKYVEKFNVIHNIVNAFLGEEINRPFGFSVVNNNKEAVNEIIREKEFRFRKYLEKAHEKAVEKAIKFNQLDAQYKQRAKTDKPMTNKNYKAEIDAINNYLDNKYKIELDPAKYNESIKNIMTTKEKSVEKLLKLLMRELKIKYIKNKTFQDVILVDREFVEIKPDKQGNLPTIRDLNTINVFYEESENIEYIQDRNYAGYVELVPYADVINNYDLTNDEIKLLNNFTHGNVYGTDDVMHRTSGLGPNDWETRTRAGHFTNNVPFGVGDDVMTVPNYFGNTTYVYGKGLNADSVNGYDKRYCTVYTCYFVSQRQVGFYTFQNEYGELETEIVSEDFPVPNDANKERYIPEKDKKNLFAEKKIRYVWYCEQDKFHSIEWKYIPEIWQGTRINGNIYKNIQPVQHAYQSLLDPYKKKLPIYGRIFNNRNAYSVSVVDRLKPWYKLYLIIMSKLLKNITNDRGILTFVNISMVDDEIGWENTLRLLEENNLVPYNPFNKSQGTQFNTAKIAERLDATNSGSSQYYIQLLEFIEGKIKSASGMSDQRMADIKQNTGSQINQQATMYSHNISETMFNKHELLWEEIMQGLLELTISMVDNSSGVIRGYLNDDEIALINLDNISLEDEYLLSLQMNNKSMRILRDSYQLLHAMFQNDKIDLVTMIELLEQEDIGSLKSILIRMQKEQEEAAQQQQEAQAKQEKEMLQMEIDNREDAQISRLDEIALKGKLDYNRDYMKSQMMNTSFDTEKDYNKDGIKDYMQLEQLNQRIQIEAEKNNIEREKLNLEKVKETNKTNNDNKKINHEISKSQRDANLKERDITEKAKSNIIKQRLKN